MTLVESKELAQFEADLQARAKSLEMLYDYTKFHIGVYLTLTASYITVVTLKVSREGADVQFLSANQILMGLAIVCFLAAGVAAGVIASSITQCGGGNSREFLQSEIGPWNAQRIHMPGLEWTFLEHTSFWIGILTATLSFFVPRIQ